MAARLHWTWPAKSIMARGPVVELAIVAGNPSDNHWFELAPFRPPSQAHLPTSKIWTNVTTSFDASDVTFSMTLVRRELRSDLGVPKAKVGFEFIPQPPNVERPDGSIRVLVTGLTCAGKYWLKILGDGSPIFGSPYVVTVAPGPATELRAVPNQPAYRPPKKAEIAKLTTLATGFALLLFLFIRQALRGAAQNQKMAEKMGRLRQALDKALGRRPSSRA